MALLVLLALEGECQEGQKKVAVVGFSVNKKIDTEGLGATAKASTKLLSSLTNLVGDPNFDLSPILENFKERFFAEFAPNFPFELLPEEEVIGNPDYVSYESNVSGVRKLTVSVGTEPVEFEIIGAEGYKPIAPSGLIGKTEDAQNMLEMFKDKADGVMGVNLYYGFSVSGIGVVKFTRVKAYISFNLWRTDGKQKRVFSIFEEGSSKDIIPSPGGIPIVKTEKMLTLCKQATEKMLADLSKKGKMKKIAKKAAKKF